MPPLPYPILLLPSGFYCSGQVSLHNPLWPSYKHHSGRLPSGLKEGLNLIYLLVQGLCLSIKLALRGILDYFQHLALIRLSKGLFSFVIWSLAFVASRQEKVCKQHKSYEKFEFNTESHKSPQTIYLVLKGHIFLSSFLQRFFYRVTFKHASLLSPYKNELFSLLCEQSKFSSPFSLDAILHSG